MSSRRYRVRHTTSYSYEVTASLAYNVVSSRPRQLNHQNVTFYRAVIEPEVQNYQDFKDFFGNSFRYFAIEHEFQGLCVTCLADVEVHARTLENRTVQTSLGQVQEWSQGLESHDLHFRDSQFLHPSPLVEWSDPVYRYALDCVDGCSTALEAIDQINRRIHRDFSYKPGSTHLTSSVDEVFAQKQGVCQDFAHLGIALCRSLGLASRYVSGYLLTVPPPGQPKLVGADASHAWFSVLLPGPDREGVWVDFDPTNSCRVALEHICQAWGRDYGDVSPVRGVVMGGGLQHVTVAVDVIPS